MRNAISLLICTAAMLTASGTVFADVRCWMEPDGFEECRNDPAYDPYKNLRDERGLIVINAGDVSNEELERVFGGSLADEIKAKARKEGKTVRQLMAEKILK